MIAIDAEQAGEEAVLIFAHWPGMVNFQKPDDAARARHWKYVSVLTRRVAPEVQRRSTIVAGAQLRARIEGRQIVGMEIRVRDGDAALRETHAFLKPKFTGATGEAPENQLRRAEQFRAQRRQGDLKFIPVAARSEVGDRFDDMGHNAKLGAEACAGLALSRSTLRRII
jgi:hypothetical protein